MELIFSEDHMPGQAVIDRMEEAAVRCAEHEGVDPERVSVSVTFVDPLEIQELNRIHRQKDAVTDVLSFPQFESPSDMPAEGEICLGDVVICSEQALLQADEYGHSGERELVYLFVHSMFHLLGYDHMNEEERAEMRKREESVMDALGVRR